MKQTAVDWLLDNLISEPYSEEDFNHNSNMWDKANEMEKKQIERAFMFGQYTISIENGEQYYNETFKNK